MQFITLNVFVDAEIFLSDDKQFAYNLILGTDVLYGITVDFNRHKVIINNFSILKYSDEFMDIDDGKHDNCKFDCNSGCVKSKCEHKFFKVKQNIHFKIQDNYFLKLIQKHGFTS